MEFKEYEFEVTRDWLLNNVTDKGSWNAKQLACLCIDWPPRKGWISRAVGTTILVSVKERFEQLAREPAKDMINVQDQERRIKQLEHDMCVVLANLNISL